MLISSSKRAPLALHPCDNVTINRSNSQLSSKELENLSKNEYTLIKTIVDMYRTGAISSIEGYSGGYRGNVTNVNEFSKMYKPTNPLKPGSERFIFELTGHSPESQQLLRSYGIFHTHPNSNGMEELAGYAVAMARAISNTETFYEKDTRRFGLTLNGPAKRLLHKVNMVMNPTSRGCGD